MVRFLKGGSFVKQNESKFFKNLRRNLTKKKDGRNKMHDNNPD